MADAQRSISSREFAEWMAYDTLEPFGEEWLRTASIVSMIANVNRDAEKRPEPFRPEEFMPRPQTLTPALSQEERGNGEGESGGWRETKRRFMALVARK